MLRVVSILSICTFLALTARAQEISSFTTIDAETYRLYTEKKWDSLIFQGKEALDQNIDYFFLRLRVGIAYYNEGNYRMAVSHFEKALQYNEEDAVTLEYLYYAVLFSGDEDRSLKIMQEFPPGLFSRIPVPPRKPVESIHLEYLYSNSMNDEITKDPAEYFEGFPTGRSTLTNNFSNASISMKHLLTPGWTVFHAFTHLNKNNFFYYDDGDYNISVNNLNVRQNQYYLSIKYTSLKGLSLIPFFHYLDMNYQSVSSITGTVGNPQVSTGDYTDNDYVTGLALQKSVGLFDLFINSIYSSIGNREYAQSTAGITCFPSGNLDFYLSTLVSGQYTLKDDQSELQVFPELVLGWGINRKLWLEATATAGKIRSFADRNAYIVYNNPDWIRSRFSLNIIIPVTDRGSQLYFGSKWIKYESDFYYFDATQTVQADIITFNNLSFFGGISWKL